MTEGGCGMTPEERARAAVDGWHTKPEPYGKGPDLYAFVAAAIREAEAAERERAAKVAEFRAEHHRDNCHPGCRCGDGWHIAAAIREGT